MKKSDIDHLIAHLAEALLTNEESFETLAKQQSNNLSIDDLSYLLGKLHNPPPANPGVPYPNGSSLFYYPENYNFRTENISQYMPSVEEVVDKCLSYKPIIL